jgi:hypothetical protein
MLKCNILIIYDPVDCNVSILIITLGEIWIMVFGVMKSWSFVDHYHLLEERVSSIFRAKYPEEDGRSIFSEPLVTTSRTERCHNPEHSLNRHRCQNINTISQLSSPACVSYSLALQYHCKRLQSVIKEAANKSFENAEKLKHLEWPVDSKEFWRWCIILRITEFYGLCPSSGNLETRKQRFGSWICFRPQVSWGGGG